MTMIKTRSKTIFTRFALIVMVGLFGHLLAAPDMTAQTVISKSRIGGYSEDIAYVSRGRLRDQIIILDGYEVFAVENARRPRGRMTKLFDVKVPELNFRPNGIAFIESEDLFAFNDITQPTKLFLFDEKGEFKGTRTIQYLNSGYVPQHMEGIAYIPSISPAFPDHLILVVYDNLTAGPVRLEVIRRDGVAVAEISRHKAGLACRVYLRRGRSRRCSISCPQPIARFGLWHWHLDYGLQRQYPFRPADDGRKYWRRDSSDE
jgi:hypothetical protein